MGCSQGPAPCFPLAPAAVTVEMDSKTAFNLITVRCPRGHPCSDLVRDIQFLAALNWNVSFHFVYREANRCADHLASLGHNSIGEEFSCSQIPRTLFPLLRDDVIGVAFPRLTL